MKYFYLLCLIICCVCFQSCRKCKTVSSDINNPSNPCSAAFTFEINCNEVTFTDSSSVPNMPGLTWEFLDGTPASSTAQNPTITYTSCGTYKVCLMVDNIGSLSSCSDLICKNIVIEDTTDPVLVGVPDDTTIACGDVPNPANPTATDNCDIEVLIAFNESTTNGDCPNNYTLTRTWTATDKCGNEANRVQIITVENSAIPEILTEATDLIVDCDGSTAALNNWLSANGGAISSDVCSDITWTNDFTALTDNCGVTGNATVNFTVTDACGNPATTTANFTVQDLTPPEIKVAASDIMVQCDGAGNIEELNAWLTANGNAEATDCNNISWSHNFDSLSDLCGDTGSATVTFTATDDCDNASMTTAIFSIVDDVPPTAVCLSGVKLILDENCAIGITSETIDGGSFDNCQLAFVTVSPSFFDHCGSFEVTLLATDLCDNTSTCTTTIEVIDDIPPTILCPVDMTVDGVIDGEGQCTAFVLLDSPTTVDNCSSVTTTNDAPIGSIFPMGTTLVTWTAEDDCMNITTCSFLVTVECESCCMDEMAFYTNAANVETNGALGSCFINFMATGLNECMQITYNWGDSQQSGPFPNSSSVTHTYSGPGTYTVCTIIEEVNAEGNVCWVSEQCEDIMIFCDDCCIDFDIFANAIDNAVSVSTNNDNCTATFSIDGMPYCDFIDFVDWGDGQVESGPFSTGIQFSHQYSGSGNYSICWSSYEEFDGVTCFFDYQCEMVTLGCSTFTGQPNMRIYLFNGNSIGKAKNALEQSEQEYTYKKEPTIKLFPNPTTDILNLHFENNTTSERSIQIVDRSGQIMHFENLKFGMSEFVLSLNNLPTGVYFVKITENGAPIWIEKIIKQ